jgi:hypothetical protein
MEKDKKFDEYYKLISNRFKSKIFSTHKIVGEIVKLLYYEAETSELTIKEIMEIIDIVKEMILKFRLSIS